MAAFIDDSASRARVGDSDRAPVIRNRRQARQYNQLQDAYVAALAPFAASARTVPRPQYVPVPAAGRRRRPAAAAAVPVMAVATQPVLPGALVKAKAVREKGQPSKAELARKAAAKRVAEHRRAQPGPYAVTRNELKVAHELVRGGVRMLTWCARQQKKTGNYDAKVVPMKRRTLKDGSLSKQQYRLVSKCKECHAAKSTILASGPDPPKTVHGGTLPPVQPYQRLPAVGRPVVLTPQQEEKENHHVRGPPVYIPPVRRATGLWDGLRSAADEAPWNSFIFREKHLGESEAERRAAYERKR